MDPDIIIGRQPQKKVSSIETFFWVFFISKMILSMHQAKLKMIIN